MKKNPFLTLGALIVLVAAGIAISQSRVVPNGLGRAPEVVSFTARPASQPGSTVLSWRAHAVSVVIEATPVGAARDATELIADLSPNGSLSVHPKVTTKYVMRCVGPFSGYAGLPVEVTVEGSGPAPADNVSL